LVKTAAEQVKILSLLLNTRSALSIIFRAILEWPTCSTGILRPPGKLRFETIKERQKMVARLQRAIAGFAALPVKSRLLQNMGALALVQAVSYAVPLITLPYLTRVLGLEEWGRVSWMQIIISYFTVFTDWGFSWSGVRKVSSLRHDPEALSEVFLGGWLAQWFLCIVALGTLCWLYLYAPFFVPFRAYAISTGAAIVSGVLFPVWILSGLERIGEVAIIQLSIRAASVPLIFVLVKGPGDGPQVISASAITGLIGGATALFWMRKNLSLSWHFPGVSRIWAELSESGSFFFSRVWIVLYTSMIPTVLGTLAGAAAVGEFMLADRIRAVAQSLLTPVSQALFPRMSYLFNQDRTAALLLLRRSAIVITLISGTVSICLFVFAQQVIMFAGGPAFLKATTLLRWLSPLPLVISISQIASVQVLLPARKHFQFNLVLLVGGVLGLSTSWVFIKLFEARGAVWFMLVVEVLVCVGMWTFAYAVIGKSISRSHNK
jgi:O-antigen/teichoic acid export membrane protein